MVTDTHPWRPRPYPSGDTDGSDDATVLEVLEAVRTARPDIGETDVVAQPVTDFNDVMRAMEPLGAVIATRYHNLIAALKLSKPTIALGYSRKHHSLMSDLGLAEFSHSVASLDVTSLTQQFLEMEARSDQLRDSLAANNAKRAEALERQFDQLDEVLFGKSRVQHGDDPRTTPALADLGSG